MLQGLVLSWIPTHFLKDFNPGQWLPKQHVFWWMAIEYLQIAALHLLCFPHCVSEVPYLKQNSSLSPPKTAPIPGFPISGSGNFTLPITQSKSWESSPAHTPPPTISKSCCLFLKNSSRICPFSTSWLPLSEPPSFLAWIVSIASWRVLLSSLLLSGMMLMWARGLPSHIVSFLGPKSFNGSSLPRGKIQSSFHPHQALMNGTPHFCSGFTSCWSHLCLCSSHSGLLAVQIMLMYFHLRVSRLASPPPWGLFYCGTHMASSSLLSGLHAKDFPDDYRK